MKLVFSTILDVSPSLNKLHGNKWEMLNAKNKYLRQLKGYEIYSAGKDKRYVSIVRHGSRELDIDNFYGGLKPLIDALKEKGIIYDDRSEYFHLVAKQEKCKRGQSKTVIEVLRMA